MPIWTNPGSPKVKSILNWIVCGVFGVGLAAISLSVLDKEVPLFVRIFGMTLAVITIALPWLTSKDSVFPEPERLQMKGLPRRIVFAGLLFFVAMTVVPIKAVAAVGAFDCGSIPCDEFDADTKNKPSLQRGAQLFINYCMGCHSAKFSRYERVADDLGIPHDLMMENLVFADKKIGDLMTISMNKAQSKSFFGAAPPDLTLVARARNPEWLYTYLRNFYKDDTRPLGVNNRVFANVGMPHAMLELQGLLECGAGPQLDSDGRTIRNALGEAKQDEHCGGLFEGALKGSMDEEQFDGAIYDLVNFLEYVADPTADDRRYIGIFVLLFLVVFLVLTILLNREYWKGIH
jgi:ubiquinol-cytochrome c reductase cytochrome b subunit